MNVQEYIESTGTNVHALALRAGISYGSLRKHVLEGRGLSLASAKKFEICTSGEISAVDALGLAEEQPRRPKRRKSRKAA